VGIVWFAEEIVLTGETKMFFIRANTYFIASEFATKPHERIFLVGSFLLIGKFYLRRYFTERSYSAVTTTTSVMKNERSLFANELSEQ